MTSNDEGSQIREEDVEARPLRRRAFLGRFGVAAGVAGVLGWTVACGESGASGDACDDDPGDPADSDPGDAADSDSGDPCDSD